MSTVNYALIAAALMFYLYFSYKLMVGFHMLQQNSYFNISYFKWVKDNIKKNILIRDFLPPILFAILYFVFKAETAAFIVFGLCYVALFLARPKVQAKKPLVITARVKRLMITSSVILLLGLLSLINDYFRMLFVDIMTNEKSDLVVLLYMFDIVAVIKLSLLGIFSFLFVALVNIINRPIELSINKWYYNDAKKRLRAMPNLKVVGITGSYGKTSSKYILNRILQEEFNVLMTPESYNTTMGVIKTVRMKLQPYHEVFVCEMGAKYVGDIKEICDLVLPQYGIITSIGPQHLETFGSIENIIATKYELADALPDKGKAVLNLESELIRSNIKYTKTVGYGLSQDNNAKYWAENIRYGAFGSAFTLCSDKGERIELETKLLGRHNILNIIGAAAMANILGMELSKIAYAVKRLEPVPHRLELKMKAGNISVIDDAFNSNIEGAKSAVEVLGSFTTGKRILITPGIIELGDKEYEYNKAFGIEAAKHCDFIILVGEKRTRPIKDGLTQAHYPKGNLYIAANLNEALKKMQEIAASGSVVLFENDLPDLYNE